MLDCLLNSDESTKNKLTDEQIIDMIITILYSGYETVSTTCMMAVKYIHDHPKVLEELRVRGFCHGSLTFFFFFDLVLI